MDLSFKSSGSGYRYSSRRMSSPSPPVPGPPAAVITTENVGGGGGGISRSMEDKTVENLSEVFRCFICMEKLKNARLCPHCSKLCCYSCVHRWITQQKQECPHCRASLRLSDMVNCRWVEEVTQQLDTLKENGTGGAIPKETDEENDACCVHPDEKQSVYCCTCNTCICHQCALWGGTSHSGHTFRPLDEVYRENVVQIQEEVAALRRRLVESASRKDEIVKNEESVKTGKDDHVREIRNAVELMIARLDAQLKSKLISLINQKLSISQETEQTQALLNKMISCLSLKTRSSLLGKSVELLSTAAQIQKKPIASLAVASNDYVSEIVPQYDSATFKITHFTSRQNKAKPLYSTPLNVNGLSWRLKVYPDGNGIVRGNYLSVFLELSAGLPEASKYEYRVEMIHQGPNESESKNVVREFAADFEVGECWGYNRFFRLDLLASEGFIDPETDSLVLKFHVRPPTYFQQCRDQQWYIHQLQALQAGYAAQIADLKDKLSLQMSSGLQLLPRKTSTASPSQSNSKSAENKYRRRVDENLALAMAPFPRPRFLPKYFGDSNLYSLDEPKQRSAACNFSNSSELECGNLSSSDSEESEVESATDPHYLVDWELNNPVDEIFAGEDEADQSSELDSVPDGATQFSSKIAELTRSMKEPPFLFRKYNKKPFNLASKPNLAPPPTRHRDPLRFLNSTGASVPLLSNLTLSPVASQQVEAAENPNDSPMPNIFATAYPHFSLGGAAANPVSLPSPIIDSFYSDSLRDSPAAKESRESPNQ